MTDSNPSSEVVVPKIAPGDGIAEMQGVLDRHAPGQREAASAATSPAATILIVDDEIQNRKLLEVLLRAEGYLTLSAANGEEALAAIAKRAPDLILLDVVMPGMDGYQACRRLADDPVTRTIPVIFVSTKNQRADQVWARMQGGKDLIGKPYTIAQVLAALKHAAAKPA